MPVRAGYSTGDKFIRVIDLLDRLGSTRVGLTTAELAETFEVNVRSATQSDHRRGSMMASRIFLGRRELPREPPEPISCTATSEGSRAIPGGRKNSSRALCRESIDLLLA
jgi:hypothetical protein